MAEGGKADKGRDWADSSPDEGEDHTIPELPPLKIDLPPSDTDNDQGEEKADSKDDTKEEAKLKRMNKDKLIDKLKKLKSENAKLQTQNDALSADNTSVKADMCKLKTKIQALEIQRDSILDDLSNTTSKLDDQTAITKDLLDQLQNYDPTVTKKILLLMDKNRIALRPYLKDDRFEFTFCTIIDEISDIISLLNDENGIEEIRKHDKVIVSVGQSDILDGNLNGRAAATKILHVAESIVNLGVEVAVIAIPPAKNKQGQVLLCNTRMSKMPDIKGIDYIGLDKLSEMEKDKILLDVSTLTPDGAKEMAKILLDNLVVKGESLPVKKPSEQKDVTPKPGPSGLMHKPEKMIVKIKTRSDSSDSSDDEPEVEETMFIKQSEVGRIIGIRGTRIKALQAKTGATMYVEDYEKDGITKSWVFISGKERCVKQAKEEIAKVMREKSTAPRGPLSGTSPKPKKQKKGGSAK